MGDVEAFMDDADLAAYLKDVVEVMLHQYLFVVQ